MVRNLKQVKLRPFSPMRGWAKLDHDPDHGQNGQQDRHQQQGQDNVQNALAKDSIDPAEFSARGGLHRF
jgi:hypothetical protein